MLVGKDEAFPPGVSCGFGGVDFFTGRVAVDGYTRSCGLQRDGEVLCTVMVMEVNVDFGRLPTISGTLAAFFVLRDPLSAA